MGYHGLAWPDGASLLGGVVADGEHEIELRRVRTCKLVPGFGAKLRDVEVRFAQHGERKRIDRALGVTSCAIAFELAEAEPVQNCVGHDRSR